MTTQPKKLSYAEIKSRKKPATETIYMPLDPDLAASYDAARDAYKDASRMLDIAPDVTANKTAFAKAKKERDRLYDELMENCAEFTFRALGANRLDDLMSDNPPTDEQIEKAESENLDVQYNNDTFPQALVAASLVTPVMTEEEAAEMWTSDDWNQAELVALWLTALKVNQTHRTVDLKKD